MIWRNPYDVEECEAVGKLCATVNLDPSLTVQSFERDANLNNLVAKFGIKGVPVHPMPLRYGDFSDAPDLREALEIMREAKESFMSLPATVRRRFDNDPAELYAFLQDPSNLDEALRLGLVEKRPEEAVEAPKPQRRRSDLPGQKAREMGSEGGKTDPPETPPAKPGSPAGA